jgi:hypothetical protein
LKKRGWRFSKIEKDTFSLLNPKARIQVAKNKGISFIKKNGKLVPIRRKK